MKPPTERPARRAGRDIGAVGRISELKTIRRLEGRATPGSGNMRGAKGDIRRPDFLIENKSTVRASFGMTHDVLAKISQEALAVGKTPALALQFTNEDGRPTRFGRWVMVPEHIFKEMEALYAERMNNAAEPD